MTLALDEPLLAEDFDYQDYLAKFDTKLLADPEGRRVLTRLDPLLFAIVYFRDALRSKETGNEISFSQFHLDAYESAKRWARQSIGPGEIREGWVAPRGSGKSTVFFKILPIWALAHGHVKFIAAFAHSDWQAQQRLMSLKQEFDFNKNPLLYRDYPELCKPMTRGKGNIADNLNQYIAKSGAVIIARGMDSTTLGANVFDERPGMLLLDDIEPDESNYSPYMKQKRLNTVLGAVFGMNPNAIVQFVGTTTMHGSIMHDLVRSVTEFPKEQSVLHGETASSQGLEWVREQGVVTHYYPAIVTADNGSERSLWPRRWPFSWLQSQRHTRAFRKDYLNLPAGLDGGFWTQADFRYDIPELVTRRILSVDPAVTTKSTSDYTGLAVIGYDTTVGRCIVESAMGVKLGPSDLRKHVLAILSANPSIRAVLIETNQGGDWGADILSPLPVKILTVHQSEKKEIRSARVLDYYQQGWVSHVPGLTPLEDQQMAYPHVTNDDILDAVCSGVQFFMKDRKKSGRHVGATSQSYV